MKLFKQILLIMTIAIAGFSKGSQKKTKSTLAIETEILVIKLYAKKNFLQLKKGWKNKLRNFKPKTILRMDEC